MECSHPARRAPEAPWKRKVGEGGNALLCRNSERGIFETAAEPDEAAAEPDKLRRSRKKLRRIWRARALSPRAFASETPRRRSPLSARTCTSTGLSLLLLAPASLGAQDRDPRLDRIEAILKRGSEFIAAKKIRHTRRALRACWKLVAQLGERGDSERAQAATWKLASLASSVQERKIAHDAYAIVYEYRAKTMRDDSAKLAAVCINLAENKRLLGDLAACAVMAKRALRACRTLAPDDARLQAARVVLGNAYFQLQDYARARPLFEQSIRVLARTTPRSLTLASARSNLAGTYYRLGLKKKARATAEALYRSLEGKVPEGYPLLQTARMNLGVLLNNAGEYERASPLLEKTYRFLKNGIGDKDLLQATRQNLAKTRRALGDSHGYRELLEEAVTAYAGLPDRDDRKRTARYNLASAMMSAGDIAGAHEILQQICSARASGGLFGDQTLRLSRLRLAAIKDRLGDHEAAYELTMRVRDEVRELDNSEHPEAALIAQNCAVSYLMIGRVEEAIEVLSEVLANSRKRYGEDDIRTRSVMADLGAAWHLGDQHARAVRLLRGSKLDRVATRLMLASSLLALGDGEGAFEIASRLAADELEKAGSTRARKIRILLAMCQFVTGDHEGVEATLLDQARATKERLDHWALAPRELASLSAEARPVADLMLALRTARPQAGARLAREALLLYESLRHAAASSARDRKVARAHAPERLAALEQALERSAAAIARHTRSGEGKRREALFDRIADKERIEARIASLVREAGKVARLDVRASHLAARLPKDGVAVSIVAHRTPAYFRASAKDLGSDEYEVSALILRSDARVDVVRLGTRQEIESRVDALRAASAADSVDRSVRDALHRVVLAPILKRLGRETKSCTLALCPSLELAPLESLIDLHAEESGVAAPRFRRLRSLFEVLEAKEERAERALAKAPSALFVGGVDYDARARAQSPGATASGRATAPGQLRRFGVLAASGREVDALSKLFKACFASGDAAVLRGEHAHTAGLQAAVTGKRFIHLATHGFFRPEGITDAGPDRRFELLADRGDVATRLSRSVASPSPARTRSPIASGDARGS